MDYLHPIAGASYRNFALRNLDPGEEDAIALAVENHADLVLMDDREGVLVARREGLPGRWESSVSPPDAAFSIFGWRSMS